MTQILGVIHSCSYVGINIENLHVSCELIVNVTSSVYGRLGLSHVLEIVLCTSLSNALVSHVAQTNQLLRGMFTTPTTQLNSVFLTAHYPL